MKKAPSYIRKNSYTTEGFSLVEILIAISVFLIFSYALATIIVNTERQLKHATNTERAASLAEEGLEAVRNIRDNNFSNLSNGTFGLATTTNQYNLSGSSDLTGLFTRQLTLSTISPSQKQVNSTVTWVDQISSTNSLTLSTYITNWRAITASQATTLTISTSTAYIRSSSRAYIRGISLSNTSLATSTITAMTVSWTKPSRTLSQINSPYGSTIYGPGSASSGSTVNLSPIITLGPNSSGRLMELIFSNVMSGATFTLTITFTMGDNSSQTVYMTNIPISTP